MSGDVPKVPKAKITMSITPQLKYYLGDMANSENMPEMKGKTPEEIAEALVVKRIEEMIQNGWLEPIPEERARELDRLAIEKEQEERLRKRTRRGSSEPSGGVGGP